MIANKIYKMAKEQNMFCKKSAIMLNIATFISTSGGGMVFILVGNSEIGAQFLGAISVIWSVEGIC